MNTNFIGRPQECLDYINKQSDKSTTNQEIVDNFLGVYSKKYLGKKDVVKEVLTSYPDSKNFKEIINKVIDPKLLIVSNSELWEIHDKIHGNIKNLSSISCSNSSLPANFGFITSSNSSDSSIAYNYFGYLSLDDTVCKKVSSSILKELSDVAFIANHDYIHSLSLGNESKESNYLFTEKIRNRSGMPGYEYMSLSFHYAIFQDIYIKYPHIKKEIIQKAENYLIEVEKDPNLGESEKEYLIGIYNYFLRRILPCGDRPKELSAKLCTLLINDDFPSGENIKTNSNLIDTTYQELKEGKTIIDP